MKKRGKRGFTLIELLTVILIIAIAAGIVVPAYDRFYAKRQFNEKVGEVESLFNEAHRQAIALDETVTVQWDPAHNAFLLLVPLQPPPTDTPVALQQDVTSQPMPQSQPVELGDDVRVLSFTPIQPSVTSGSLGGMTQVNFYGDGTCDGAQISLVSAQGYETDLLLQPATSQIESPNVSSETQGP
ncbi:pilus assembly FimT family protein [Chthonomonas calidirosea]|uniref:pilus assembly FimT family protein n=1 Tax=Chthonomonas calidirosea TaxID=454171 RepID=UPI0006EC8AD3|nr:prepilin-type N-terminal cleavage/methylation domain-containing protein [Chthonomonas calidirosea]CEK14835.1 prepilin-type N-terminal cleavage/methylation domain-containing protein [Chthonomonas calidirosea]